MIWCIMTYIIAYVKTQKEKKKKKKKKKKKNKIHNPLCQTYNPTVV